MNKFFTLLASATLSLSLLNANATTVTVTPSGSNYDVTVDNITLNSLTAVKQGDVNVIAVNDANVTMIVRFTDVNTLVADGVLNGATFHYATEAAATFASGFQISDSDFENWDETVMEPVSSWHSFKTCFGTWASSARDQSKLYRSDYTEAEIAANPNIGNHYATVESKNVLVSIANGTLTTGRLKAGSMSATNTSNHSEMDITKVYTDDYAQYGPYYVLLQAKPDAIKSLLKVELLNSSDRATLSAAITNGSYYQEPQDADYSSVVAATAGSQSIANCAWTEYLFPFTYTEGVEANAIMVTISTNANPGQGSGGDKVSVDNVELVYNANVTNITATGLNGFTFDAATHNYEISYEGTPLTLTADNFTVTADGKAAIVVKNVTDLGGGNYRIALGAVSADMVNSSLYTITVTRQPDDIWVMGDVNGNQWAADQGVKMTYNAETKEYTITLTTNYRYYSYLSFTKRLGENANDWTSIAPYRFGAKNVAEGGNFVMREMYLGEEIELAADGWINAFQLPAGEFTLTIKDLDGDRKLIIDSESWPDPELLVYGSFNGWSGSYDECIVMTPVSDGIYTTDYESVDNGDGYSYFKFIKRHAGEEFLNIGAVSNGDFLVTTSCLNTPLSITAENGQAYKIPVGEYTLTADLNNMTLVIGSDYIGVEGDVTGDGTTDIDDVNAVINIILKVKTQDDYPGSADLNNDGTVDVDDMNLVINIILTSN